MNLAGVDLSGHDFEGCDFRRADLSGANFRSCNLSRAEFFESNLRGADLSTAQLISSDCEYTTDDAHDEYMDLDSRAFTDSDAYLLAYEYLSNTRGPEDDPPSEEAIMYDANRRAASYLWEMLDDCYVSFDDGERPCKDFISDSFFDQGGRTEEFLRDDPVFYNFMVSMFRTNNMSEFACRLWGCKWDETTLWPPEETTADYPWLCQPHESGWSNSGLN